MWSCYVTQASLELSFLIYLLISILGSELRASHLLGKRSTTRAPCHAPFCFSYFGEDATCFCWTGLDLHLLSLLPEWLR
jgi:hypothetical protein